MARQDGRPQHHHPEVHELHCLLCPHEGLQEDITAYHIGAVDGHSRDHQKADDKPQEADQPDVEGRLARHDHSES
jgi:hypothetical protein